MEAKTSVSRPVLHHSYLGGALSLAQKSSECDVRNGWFNSHHLQCPRFQCKLPAKLETRNVFISFLIHPLFSTTSCSNIVSLSPMNLSSQGIP